MLIENTLFGMNDKIQIAIDRLQEFEPPEGYCFEDSFGKDSTVVDHLLKLAKVKFDSHFCFTSVDPPELIKYGKYNRPYVIFERPEKNMWDLIVGQNLPTRINRFCCAYLKEWHGSGRVVVTGIRWEESIKRKKRQMVETCFRDSTKRFLHPIIDWKTDEIWEFIKQDRLNYCELYDEKNLSERCLLNRKINKRTDCVGCQVKKCKLWNFNRLGCIGCPMQTVKARKRDFQKYPNFKRAYLRAMKKNMDTRKTPSKFANVDEWFDWWINDKAMTADKTDLFSHFE